MEHWPFYILVGLIGAGLLIGVAIYIRGAKMPPLPPEEPDVLVLRD